MTSPNLRRGLTALLCGALALATAGCITEDAPLNQPIKDANSPASSGVYPKDYSFDSWLSWSPDGTPNPAARVRDPVIIMSFSGGFLHAAALADATLTALKDVTINTCGDGNPCPHPILDHIIVISSTSGGSFANANLLVNGPAKIGEGFKPWLSSSLVSGLLGEAGERPWSWPTIVGFGANRSQYMIDYLEGGLLAQKQLGHPITFGEVDPARHFAVFGTTDYDAERRLLFTQDQFNWICSDLGALPVAVATTASGAFPLLLTDVELRNYWNSRGFSCPLTPTAVVPTYQNAYVNLQAYMDWRYANSLVNSSGSIPGLDPPFRQVDYLHLFDGGVTDNLAIRALFRLFDGQRLESAPFQGKTILYVEVNARSDPADSNDHYTGSPGLLPLTIGVPYASIDNVTALSNSDAYYYWGSLFAAHCNPKLPPPLNSKGRIRCSENKFAHDMYLTSIDYDKEQKPEKQIALKEVGGASLSKDDIALLYDAARRLLFQDPCFVSFLKKPKWTIQIAGEQVPPLENVSCNQHLWPGIILDPSKNLIPELELFSE